MLELGALQLLLSVSLYIHVETQKLKIRNYCKLV